MHAQFKIIYSETQKPEHHHQNNPPYEASKAKSLEKEDEDSTLSPKEHSKTMSEDKSISSSFASSETRSNYQERGRIVGYHHTNIFWQ